MNLSGPLVASEDEALSLSISANDDQPALNGAPVERRTNQLARHQSRTVWEMRAVEPEFVRISTSPLSPSREVLGVVWEGTPLPLDSFLESAGKAGWEIVAAGNTGERHHRIYLKRPAVSAAA